ncbi:hypothetical protein [Paenibacillus silvae]|uniref:hypothetical protein n=1 Tax=Paenibacillus silvae TaxID=1325358 RepID=UPI00142DE5EC|nr:hypothetical protein [Paenibacillus silvae]
MKRAKCIQEYRWATSLGFVGAWQSGYLTNCALIFYRGLNCCDKSVIMIITNGIDHQ